MDVVKTRAQMIALAADELGILGAGQSLADEDEDKIDSRIDGLWAELSVRGVVDVGNDEAIPVEWSGPLAELLANECAPTFGIPKKDVSMAEERLRVMTRRQPASNRTLQFDSPLRSASPLSYRRWVSGI